MADVKISDMTPGAALDGSELFEMTQDAATLSTDADAIKTFVQIAPLTFLEAVGSSALTITGATQTASFPPLTITQTWNNAGVTFGGIKLNITNTTSAAASTLLDLQVGGVSQFSVTRAGAVTATGSIAGATLKTAGTTVGALGAATAGLRNHVTDSNTAFTAGIGAVVAGGGANVVPVFADGVAWRIG